MKVAVFGLGEAGSLIAGDLVAAGAEVHGYDPADVPTPAGVRRQDDPSNAAEDAEVTLAVTAAADARQAMEQVREHLRPGSIYADLATASPTFEADLAIKAAESGIAFADVALMAPVPGPGLGTPALASGDGAGRLAGLLNPLGAEIDVIGETAGLASARKLIRSVVTKGLAALLIEARQAGDAIGEGEWLRFHLADLLTTLDGTKVERLLSGTERHAERRLEEMETVTEFLIGLGVQPHMTRATAERLRSLVPE